MALTYTWAQDNANTQVMFYVLKVKAVYIPFIMLLMALIMGGQPGFLMAGTGYIAAHLYYFLDTLYPLAVKKSWNKNLMEPPSFYYTLFPTYGLPGGNGNSGPNTGGGPQSTGFGTVIKPKGGSTGYSSGSSSSGDGTAGSRFNFSSPFKGKGQRLGG